MALQCNHNLCWVTDPKTGLPSIKNAAAALAGRPPPANLDFVLAMIRDAIGPVGEIADGLTDFRQNVAADPAAAVHISPDSVPTRNELARIFPGTNVLRA